MNHLLLDQSAALSHGVAELSRGAVDTRVSDSLSHPEKSAGAPQLLLVDDREENLQALDALLESPNYTVFHARSGTEALQLAKDHDFAVILLDLVMPVMDGFETAARLRACPRSANTPVLMITAAYNDEQNMTRGYSLGAVDFLIKPLDEEALKAKVAKYVELYRHTCEMTSHFRIAHSGDLASSQGDSFGRAGQAPELTQQQSRVLLATGNPEGRSFLQEALLDLGVEIQVAQSSQEMLGFLLKATPALIVLDIALSDADGLEILALVRENPLFWHIPALVVTTYAREKVDVSRVYNAGAIDCIFLPFNPELLRAKIQALLNQFRPQQLVAQHVREVEFLNRDLTLSRAKLQAVNSELEERVAQRTSQLTEANNFLEKARLDALSIMEDALAARRETEQSLTRLRQEMAQRKLAEERLRRIVDSNIVGVVVTTSEGVILEANDYYLNVIGGTRRDAEEGKVNWRAMTPPEWSMADEQALGELRERGVCNPYEKEYLRRDGTRIPVLVVDTMLPGPAGQIAALVLDIGAQKRAQHEISALNAKLEQRVQERTAQLAEANSKLERRAAELEAAVQELDAFAYSVSHDLRGPLRSIDGFSRALLEDYSERLDSEGIDNLRTVRVAAQRMGQLIDDLLNLSRITRCEMNSSPVDLSRLAAEIAAGLAAGQPERQVQFNITPGVKVEADPNLMRIVMENLLGNAWKFTCHTAKALIEVGEVLNQGVPTCFIRDNGAGFDMAFAGKLFGAFQRLHDTKEFPGTGIGLATAQRVLLRHGGKIWAHAEIGKGATFFFTLPPSTHYRNHEPEKNSADRR